MTTLRKEPRKTPDVATPAGTPAESSIESPDAETRADPGPPRNPHPVLRYTTLRLAIFVVVLALLWLVRVHGVLLVALALVISGLASYALLHGQRAAMSEQVAAATVRRRARAAKRAAREDDIADEIAREQDERLAGRRTDDPTS